MKHDIAFLHTAPIHVPTFSALAEEFCPDLRVRHDVDEDLLADAREHGLDAALQERIVAAMHTAADSGAALVVCTCSTIGGAAENAGQGQGYQSQRIDRAMADEAVRLGDKILVVAALASTLQPTAALLKDSADRAGRQTVFELVQVPQAWQYFEQGDTAAFLDAIAGVIAEHSAGFDAVVLAQASMAGAASRCPTVSVPILSSPRIGVAAAAGLAQNLLDKAAS
ncbi:MAG: Asp/Glu/hydantoin racemase [Candidatus Competibacteraceae bacterium]|nr:Asp/Glu/hydantoin racemase [Candidatus Competibacteraceae bacterium]